MIKIDNPTIQDANEMWELAKRSSLDTNSSYSYLMMSKFFKDRCFTIKANINDLMGFMTGFILKDDIYFIWQICIDPDYRGGGYSRILLDTAIDILMKQHGVKFIQATVDPANEASMGMFRNFAKRNNTFFATKEGFTEEHFPDDKPEEKLIQIGPLDIKY